MQTGIFMLLINISNKLKLCVPKPARTQRPKTLYDIKAMLKLKIIILFTLIFTSCKKANKSFDEIHLSTYTDSSYIQLFVTNDSIIILQLERGECDPYMGCDYGPKYYAQTSKSTQIFKLINEHVQNILSDTFELEGIIITHASKSNLSILYKDTLVKRLNYYGSESNSSDIVEIKNKLLKLINDSERINLKISERLIDNSDLVSVDSFRITKLKPVDSSAFSSFLDQSKADSFGLMFLL